MLTLPQFLKPGHLSQLNDFFPPERRRRLLVSIAFFSLFVAAFQAYDDVSRKNRALSDALATRNPSLAHITDVSDNWYRVQPTDDVINVLAPPATIVLPSGFVRGKIVTVKDRNGKALEQHITVRAEGGRIITLPEIVIATSYGSFSFLWDGKEWTLH